jgi:16S rRNA (adenine1518-N6/adenine1519-N6)-dimethyltransferase
MRPKPKKSLGQNFLQDPNIRRKIVSCCDFSGNDTVLEIGPGQAAITSLIAPLVHKLVAVELDRELSAALTVQFKDDPAVSIINADILKYDLSKVSLSHGHRLKVFGNIPYYITSPIIEHLFTFKDRISHIYFTVQKEFGRRIVAAPGSDDYGSFSCFVQYYTQPQIEFTIKRTCFYPVPNVDSCFLSLKMRTTPAVAVTDEQRMFLIIRSSFQQRRKTLRNSVKDIISAETFDQFCEQYEMNPKARAETLSLQDFANLSNLEN